MQQDLALATLIGCTHVERNGHHYVNGMQGVPAAEQRAFLDAHGDLSGGLPSIAPKFPWLFTSGYRVLNGWAMPTSVGYTTDSPCGW